VKSTTIIINSIEEVFQSSLLNSYSLDSDREIKTRLNPKPASSKQKALPMPSVHPVTTAQDLTPYF
jgi:hypothetical protein